MAEATTRVVNIHRLPPDPLDWPDDHVYIGREVTRRVGGQRITLEESVWHNPFHIGSDGDRPRVVALYETYLRKRPALLGLLDELKGKTLVCWCAPEACHGDVLARLADEEADRE